jgi:hypothetical protein
MLLVSLGKSSERIRLRDVRTLLIPKPRLRLIYIEDWRCGCFGPIDPVFIQLPEFEGRDQNAVLAALISDA